MKSAAIGWLMAGWLVCLVGCGGSDAPTASIASSVEEAEGSPPVAPAASLESVAAAPVHGVAARDQFPEVVIRTSLGDLKLRLNAKAAPVTVENFLENYVDRGFYGETIFHHVEPGFIAAGGYSSDLQEKPVRAPIRNEARNGLKNRRGTIAMARSPEYSDGATSQFFINLIDEPAWDYDEAAGNAGYCVFGEVIEGLDVAERIAGVAVREAEGFPKLPAEHVVIHTIERVPPE